MIQAGREPEVTAGTVTGSRRPQVLAREQESQVLRPRSQKASNCPLATIAKSSAYQLSSRYPGEWKLDYVPYYARKYARRLDAEEIHDAIVKATNMPPTTTRYGQYTSSPRAGEHMSQKNRSATSRPSSASRTRSSSTPQSPCLAAGPGIDHTARG